MPGCPCLGWPSGCLWPCRYSCCCASATWHRRDLAAHPSRGRFAARLDWGLGHACLDRRTGKAAGSVSCVQSLGFICGDRFSEQIALELVALGGDGKFLRGTGFSAFVSDVQVEMLAAINDGLSPCCVRRADSGAGLSGCRRTTGVGWLSWRDGPSCKSSLADNTQDRGPTIKDACHAVPDRLPRTMRQAWSKYARRLQPVRALRGRRAFDPCPCRSCPR